MVAEEQRAPSGRERKSVAERVATIWRWLSAPDPTPPLEPFALAWLDQWREHGGSVIKQPNGGYMIGWPEYDFSPDAARQRQTLVDSGFDQARRDDIFDLNYATYSSHHSGRMRGLSDLLDEVEGGSAAVLRIVELIPEMGYPVSVEKPA